VPFHYAWVITEFPTAPKDSFLVANGAYIAAATGSDAVGAFLVDTGGQNTSAVTARIQALLGPTATVADLATVRGTIGSSLTAVDLAGLTRVELGFALVLAAAAGGLVLALGWPNAAAAGPSPSPWAPDPATCAAWPPARPPSSPSGDWPPARSAGGRCRRCSSRS